MAINGGEALLIAMSAIGDDTARTDLCIA
jgi:hypothetical protein